MTVRFTHLRELIEHRGRENGEGVFVSEPDTGSRLTFGAAAGITAQIGRILAENHFAPGDRVLVSGLNGLPLSLALLSVMANDLVAVPVSPTASSQEIGYLLGHSMASGLLLARAGAEKFLAKLRPSGEGPDFGPLAKVDIGFDRPLAPEGITLGGITALPGQPGLAGLVSVRLRDSHKPTVPAGLAMILYTSGTTGRPKGVELSHENLLAECRNVQEAHGLTPRDKALCLLPLNHVNGLVVTLLTPLYVGCGVVMPEKFSASRFWGWAVGHGVSWVSAVPTILLILLNRGLPGENLPPSGPEGPGGGPGGQAGQSGRAGETGLPPLESLASLRFLRSASSALPVAAFERLEKALGLPVIESYGITEAASQVTSNPLPPAKRKPGSVGRPYGLELAVFKDGQKFGPGDFPPLVAGPGAIGAELTGPGVTGSGEVGFGPIGEVGIRGESVFKGYWQDPEATRAAFRDGWFMTGDMGQLDAEGYLFLKGRAKELINRAGEMISPLEIDEALYQVRGVESAASVGVPHPLYGEEIVAFVNVAPGHEVTSTDLAEICRERLSPHKIPKRFYFGLELPKGPSGKIQRLKLVETYLELAKQGLGLDV